MAVLVVRRYRYGDETAVKQLVQAANMELTTKLFVSTYFKETTLQFLIILTAVVFIFGGVSIKLCWLTFPVLSVVLYIGLYIGLWRDVQSSLEDLDNIDQYYENNPKTGLWVAELAEEKSAKDYQTENPQSAIFVRDCKFGDKRLGIIGVCAIQEKQDHNNQEPPHTVGLVKRLAVERTFRRMGVGQEMFSTLWAHSLQNFRAVEVLISEHQIAARNFLEKQEFSILNMEDRSAVPAVFNFKLYRLRRACVTALTEDDLLTETIIQK